jgi:hypothetical protein
MSFRISVLDGTGSQIKKLGSSIGSIDERALPPIGGLGR